MLQSLRQKASAAPDVWVRMDEEGLDWIGDLCNAMPQPKTKHASLGLGISPRNLHPKPEP